METIKKYQNRKLYSTSLKGYVDLNYIKDLVKIGSKFQVILNKTQEDITDDIILSILPLTNPSVETIKNNDLESTPCTISFDLD